MAGDVPTIIGDLFLSGILFFLFLPKKTLWPEYKDNKDFVLLVIGREHTDEQLRAYNERKKFTFPLYPDPKREVFSLFAEKSIPRAYLFNKEGEAVYTSIGYEKEEFGYLMNAIAEALK